MLTRTSVAVGVILFGGVVAVSIGTFSMLRPAPTVADILQCMGSGRTDELDRSCLHDVFELLLQERPAREIMRDITDTFPHLCHPLGHVLGQATYRAVGDAEAAYTQCSPTTCASACLHGVTGEALFAADGTGGSAEEWQHPSWDMILTEGSRLCTNYSACHALGHILYLYSEERSRSLAACDMIAPPENADGCYLGVFMENFAGTFLFTSDVEGVPTERIVDWNPENLLSPCDDVAHKYQPSCFQYLVAAHQSSFDERELSRVAASYQQFLEACRTVTPSAIRATCFAGVGRSFIAPESNLFTVTNAFAWCKDAETEYDTAACLYGLTHAYASYGINESAAVEACSLLTVPLLKTGCFRGLFEALERGERRKPESLCNNIETNVCEAELERYRADPAPFVVR